jgi:hypothetical protein
MLHRLAFTGVLYSPVLRYLGGFCTRFAPKSMNSFLLALYAMSRSVPVKKNRRTFSKDLTRRETALLQCIREGKTISESALVAGYSMKWPGQAGSQAFKNIQRKWPAILHELGRTVESIREFIKTLDDDL